MHDYKTNPVHFIILSFFIYLSTLLELSPILKKIDKHSFSFKCRNCFCSTTSQLLTFTLLTLQYILQLVTSIKVNNGTTLHVYQRDKMPKRDKNLNNKKIKFINNSLIR